MNDDELQNSTLQRSAPPISHLLGTTPVTRLVRWATSSRFRVLAYHDVPDPIPFSRQLDLICKNYRPISGADVVTARAAGRQLPHRAIWLTFDDAHPGVLAHALPLLAERQLPATLFVCPGLVDTDLPYWWQVIEVAIARGLSIEFDGKIWSDPSLITYLKSVPDTVRRAVVADVTAEISGSGDVITVQQVTSEQLRSWLNAGLELGNHTWDHPCLDTCTDEQQRDQIIAADDWLRRLVGRSTRLFAFPNGNVTPASRRILADLGYTVTALFDHRLSRLNGPEVSRLRVDACASAERFCAIASGAHSTAFAMKRRMQRKR